MSAKRPPVDLMILTSELAAPMPEALQRAAQPAPTPLRAVADPAPKPMPITTTPNLQALAFKVPPEFRKRFKLRAAEANLKLNQLLFDAFDAWEQREGLKR